MVLASAQMTATSPTTDLRAHHHSQGQMPPEGVSDPAKEESKITFLKDEVRSVGGTAEGFASGLQETSLFLMPSLKIEDKASRGGRRTEDGHTAGGASLGSAGQSPSSSLSTHSSPSTSFSSAPTMERSSPNSLPDQQSHFDLGFAQHNVQMAHSGTRVGTQLSPVSTRTGHSDASLTGTDRSGSRKGEEEMKGALLGSRGSPAADLTGRSTSRGSGMEGESSRAGSATSDLPQDLGGDGDWTAGDTKKKTSQNSELPPRTTVRRAMSECSHLAVPTLVAGAYPAGVGGSPLTPTLPDFALMGTISPPRAPYPHVAVRRSLTVTDGTGAAAAWATAMPPPFMTSPLLPASPPPKRHPGSCETTFLLPVPPHTGTSSSQEIENGKLDVRVTAGVDMKVKTWWVKSRFPFFDQSIGGHAVGTPGLAPIGTNGDSYAESILWCLVNLHPVLGSHVPDGFHVLGGRK
ncbi:unnamed protein product [Tetraodon nigroviridis]|uniref:(spotted green pufferfish) hypothetical protein n=1 Tax=Tetraodon nigroviridis TaxID=99883 RepID=Q4TAV2_TETNG|nr:unnamed protein product [Tetraodon nigroviridis]